LKKVAITLVLCIDYFLYILLYQHLIKDRQPTYAYVTVIQIILWLIKGIYVYHLCYFVYTDII